MKIKPLKWITIPENQAKKNSIKVAIFLFAPSLIKERDSEYLTSWARKKLFHLEASHAQEDVDIFLCIIIHNNFIYKSWARNIQNNHIS